MKGWNWEAITTRMRKMKAQVCALYCFRRTQEKQWFPEISVIPWKAPSYLKDKAKQTNKRFCTQVVLWLSVVRQGKRPALSLLHSSIQRLFCTQERKKNTAMTCKLKVSSLCWMPALMYLSSFWMSQWCGRHTRHPGWCGSCRQMCSLHRVLYATLPTPALQ